MSSTTSMSANGMLLGLTSPKTSGSSDSSDSSSSSSSSSDSDAAPNVPAPKPIPRPPRRGAKDMSAGERWGVCRLTRTKTGFQMTCAHPKHNPAGATAACTKTRSSAIAGEEAALVMLKTWALWGQDADSKAAHQSVWKRVLDASRAGNLPSMAVLDANPVQAYPD